MVWFSNNLLFFWLYNLLLCYYKLLIIIGVVDVLQLS